MNKVFSELNGFVIYNPSELDIYLKNNNLKNNDILLYLTETIHGDILVQKGIMIPIINIPSDYYNFQLISQVDGRNIVRLAKSKGWLLLSTSGIINIVGIGFLKDISLINNNYKQIKVPQGFYNLTIISYYDNKEPGFLLDLELTNEKQKFRGSYEFDYEFDY
ncbi:hypothetical protein HX014_15755 [Myroides marinus]|uniref:hypothetical protein n=1 Tax=Myroides marinus TaxID=703342 RepID=UPI002574D74A|nr:hypothetical protein [Myroides marinus]MDM1352061.1 hypothetical protein [Myroides marinus]MDM1359253.1 hypothetical protein [Myroides marinus]